MEKRIVVLIPSLNPNEYLIKYIENLIKSNNNIDIVIIDDGSKDELKYIFKKLDKIKRCTVLTHAVNLGKGRALKTGFNYFINNYKKNDVIGLITADSDGQHDIEDILKINKKLSNLNKESLILGTRNFNENNVPIKSKTGNKITTFVFKLLYGKKINDTQTGLRGLTYDLVKKCITIKGERFEYEINMLIEVVRDNVDIIELPIKTIYFNNNSETHFNPIKDSIKIYSVMLSSFIKFILSSISSFIIDITLFTIIYSLIHNILLSTIIARLISSFYNYFINKNIVFNNKSSKKNIIKYYTLCIIQTIMSWLLVELTYIIFKSGIYPSLIKIVIDSILFILSFHIQKTWVFRKEK